MASDEGKVTYNPGSAEIPEGHTEFSSGASQIQEKLQTIAFANNLRELKLELIVQAGRLDFLEADTNVRLAEIRLQKAQNEKLAVKIDRIQTRLDIFVLEQDPREN